MKKSVSLGLPFLFFATTAIWGSPMARTQEHKANLNVKKRFEGAWRLAWLEEPGADGEIHRADCTGLLVFTRDGHMSVQVMYRNPPTGGQAGSVQYAQGGYEASFGTYRISENTQTFTIHVEGAVVRSLIGKDLLRAFELSTSQLIVKSSDPNEHWRVAWEHY